MAGKIPLCILMLFMMPGTLGNSHMSDDCNYCNWNHLVVYGGTANLTCANSDFNPGDHPDARYQWLLPSGEILDTNTSRDHYTVSSRGSFLIVEKVDSPDFGLYHCLVMIGPDYNSIHSVVKQGINADGPYYGDMWEKYTPKIRIGLVAGGAVFVFMSMLCINLDSYSRRHDKPKSSASTVSNGFRDEYIDGKGKTEMYIITDDGDSNPAFDNPAFTSEEQADSKDNEKMDFKTYGKNDVDAASDGKTKL